MGQSATASSVEAHQQSRSRTAWRRPCDWLHEARDPALGARSDLAVEMTHWSVTKLVHASGVILDQRVVARIEARAASDAAAVAAPLRRLEPALASSAEPLAGGFAVLLGPGMYVNRGIGMGMGVETTTADLRALGNMSRKAGVASEIEISPWADPSLLSTAAPEGYKAAWFRSCLLCAPSLAGRTLEQSAIAISEVGTGEDLSQWQEAAAAGFGYTTEGQRRTSDLYAAAIASLGTYRLYVARIRGSVVGCASLSIGDGVAILGGMATAPAARREGVQRELIGHRLEAAAAAGCDLALTTTAPGSVSERNLTRRGFSVAFTKLGVVKPL